MLIKSFNHAAQSGPLVLVDLSGDDPTRGDSQGFKGIGSIVAEKLHGRYIQIDSKDLEDEFSELNERPDKLRALFAAHGYPNIVFSRGGYNHDLRSLLKANGNKLYIDSINEMLSSKYAGSSELVTHHITPELLADEGRKFERAYPQITYPLTAIMLSDFSNPFTLAERIVQAAIEGKTRTIFVCSSRRTGNEAHEALMSALKDVLKYHGQENCIALQSYNLNKARKGNSKDEVEGYNPYTGLIDKAEHILVCGSSGSMVSEPLAAGKSVHVYGWPKSFPKLRKRGLVHDFNESAYPRFQTQKIEPINLTEKIAAKIAERYRLGKLWGFVRPLTYLNPGV